MGVLNTWVNADSIGNSLRLYCPAEDYSGQLQRFRKAMRAARTGEIEITLVPDTDKDSGQEGYSNLPVSSDHMLVGMRFDFSADEIDREIIIVGVQLKDRYEIKRFFQGMEGSVKIRAIASLDYNRTFLLEKC